MIQMQELCTASAVSINDCIWPTTVPGGHPQSVELHFDELLTCWGKIGEFHPSQMKLFNESLIKKII